MQAHQYMLQQQQAYANCCSPARRQGGTCLSLGATSQGLMPYSNVRVQKQRVKPVASSPCWYEGRLQLLDSVSALPPRCTGS